LLLLPLLPVEEEDDDEEVWLLLLALFSLAHPLMLPALAGCSGLSRILRPTRSRAVAR
jgi:hypothetical protein